MDINSIFGFDRGANREAADYARQNDGQISLNPIQRLFGADEKDVQNILNREQQKTLNSTYGAALALAGRGGADWGESESSIQGRIASGQRQMKAAEEAKLRGYRKEDAKSALEQTLAVGKQSIDANAAEGRLSRAAAQDQYLHSSKTQEARYAHERSEGRLDRRHQAELTDSKDSLQMQMAIMQNDLAEKRMDYDRETARMDKRSAAIAQLMSGLGSLGGAFAL
jgi:hypothetical protein